MTDVRDQLPPEIREKHPKLVRAHNNRVMFTTIGVFLTCYAAIPIINAGYLPAGIGVLIVACVIFVYAVIILIPRADVRHCRQIGFVCPSCDAPLYVPSSAGAWSSMITKGTCPHCGYSFLPTNNVQAGGGANGRSLS